jgi:hypothetical protein
MNFKARTHAHTLSRDLHALQFETEGQLRERIRSSRRAERSSSRPRRCLRSSCSKAPSEFRGLCTCRYAIHSPFFG